MFIMFQSEKYNAYLKSISGSFIIRSDFIYRNQLVYHSSNIGASRKTANLFLSQNNECQNLAEFHLFFKDLSWIMISPKEPQKKDHFHE